MASVNPTAADQVFLPIYEEASRAVAALLAAPKCAVCKQPGPDPCRCSVVIPAEVHTTAREKNDQT